MKHTFPICALLLAVLCPTAARAQTPPSPYWSDAWRGWHFYEDPEPDTQDRAPQPKTASPTAKTKPMRPTEIVEF